MSDVIITVRGEHELRVAPERATISLSVETDGPDRDSVVSGALSLAAPVRESIVQRHDSGTVAEWSSRSIDVRADRPWNSEGKQLDPVYRAAVRFTATFSDVSDMSLWVTEISAWEGVQIGGVDWHLTPQTERAVEREVATQAVGVAVTRAGAYAEALGLHEVTPLEIADRGLISATASPVQEKALRTAAFDMAGSAPMEFEGEDIVVSATVEARFSAR
ncbi:SIMPL domain-containing protein [Microbacterium sp.]|uniref:SIMPL domain-containing protein n=1 Tax=Microbacterium sp. TaxID=51671 RepID=UPI002810AD1D|nr:SIMPL domain-containing protein [Microbacterium sp.]